MQPDARSDELTRHSHRRAATLCRGRNAPMAQVPQICRGADLVVASPEADTKAQDVRSHRNYIGYFVAQSWTLRNHCCLYCFNQGVKLAPPDIRKKQCGDFAVMQACIVDIPLDLRLVIGATRSGKEARTPNIRES